MASNIHPRKTLTPARKKAASSGEVEGEVRVIGGRWRSRKIRFSGVTGLRPTGDRIRETLFNWLQNEIVGAQCLDLFAGSGILGIETLSRGAKSCTYVETHKPTISLLRQQISKLDDNKPEVLLIHDDALKWLQSPEPLTQHDIVFVDPPFSLGIAGQCCQLLENSHLLANNALIYLEMPRGQAELTPPVNWQQIRSKSSGQVTYSLYRRETPEQTHIK